MAPGIKATGRLNSIGFGSVPVTFPSAALPAGVLGSNGHSSSSELSTSSLLRPSEHCSPFLSASRRRHARHPAKICQGTHEVGLQLLRSLPLQSAIVTSSSPRVWEWPQSLIHAPAVLTRPRVAGGDPRAPAASASEELLLAQQVPGAPLHRQKGCGGRAQRPARGELGAGGCSAKPSSFWGTRICQRAGRNSHPW